MAGFFFEDMDFRVVCVNDKFMPKGFPASSWVKKGEVYTVVEAKYLARQHMTIGYKLAELSIPEDSEYQFFLSNRFRPQDESDAEAQQAVEELLKEVNESEVV